MAMNQIKEVYSCVTADEAAVTTAIEKAKQQKIRKFPVRRIAAVAASFVVVIVAAGAVIFALQPKTKTADSAFSMQYEEAGGAKERSVEAEDRNDDELPVSGSAKNDVDIVSAVSSGDVAIEYRIRKESGYTPESLTLTVEDEAGKSVAKLFEDAPVSDGKGGWYVTARFESVASKNIICKFYDGDVLIREETVRVEE